MKNLKTGNRFLACLFLLVSLSAFSADKIKITIVDRPNTQAFNPNYIQNKAPLLPRHFIKLPVGDVKPKGWILHFLELQKEGLNGRLGEISAWLDKENNAWLGTGNDYGWEEVPYWLKGFGNMAYILGDKEMIDEVKVWIEAVFKSQREDGYFGPYIERNGKPDLWGNMIMIWCLQSYYEYSGDQRVIDLMTRYFRWQLALPEEMFLKDYWENSRGGDNLWSIFWLYNITGDQFLLELAEKTDRNTADWRQRSTLPNWHNVNIAQCFREPATYYMLSKDSADLMATYNVHHLIRNTFGQVPGGMFGADENARMGYIDPRQGTETCGFVEQMASNELLLQMTGDPFWAEHCEEVAFNSYPASVMPDFKSLRYITSPNHTVSDSENHHPGIDNRGPFLAMNPFSSRCCQHNHGQGWPYFIEHLIMATPDNGIAAAIYGMCEAKVKVAGGKAVEIIEETNYPFEESIRFRIKTSGKVGFPLYLRVPTWASEPSLSINGKVAAEKLATGKYVCIEREWRNGDEIVLNVPMKLSQSVWHANQDSRSIHYGPLTFSLKIKEDYKEVSSVETAIGDSKWQKNADPSQWPSYEIYPGSDWNYGLVIDDSVSLEENFEVVKTAWPSDNFPFTVESTPIEIKAKGKKLPQWKIDEYGLTGELPIKENRTFAEKTEEITLIPMGAARLRISAFPVYDGNVKVSYSTCTRD
ncbi:beta-L-arabinofuranosidase domain-containing protein [Proteiniphilum sp. UBA5384]|uniref:beta-L-arabinofuranosidase domain-containing protein n=1 Tax=Proteiniphilum sp. UBA5384 TaxID=1947279 RepID=UPI0025F5CEF2|nr:beta-L-arabinofuranosidase domain-containing protein [Proteiniphilum sp. UBA5384]